MNNNLNNIILVLLQCFVFSTSIWTTENFRDRDVVVVGDHADSEPYREGCQIKRRWARSVLEEVDFDSVKNVLDVGSGDGDITAGIAERFSGHVIGLDLSLKAVNFANSAYRKQSNLFFVRGDAHRLPYQDRFDVVTSFSTMHRLNDPKSAIMEIYRSLKPGGRFVAAFPVLGSPIMTEVMATVHGRQEWKSRVNKPEGKSYSLSDSDLKKWLLEAGFIVVKARTKWENEVFESPAKFRDFLRTTFGQIGALPADREVPFFEEVVGEYLNKSPMDEKGHVHFYENRIEIVAVKPLENRSRLAVFSPIVQSWTGKDIWDPALYRESCHMQRRWALSVLEDIDFDSAKNILDIGSGDGGITAGIAKGIPGFVIGVDLSPNSGGFCHLNHRERPNLFFVEGDAQELPYENRFDVVTSFSTMHRLKDPKSAILGSYRSLRPGGKFVAAFPVLGSPIMSEAIALVDSKPEWKQYFNTPDRKTYSLSDKDFKTWLFQAGFIVIKARTKWEDEVFESRSEKNSAIF